MKNQKEICPASYFNGLEGGSVHYTTRKEIQNNGGVCKKCKEKFQKKHKSSIDGKIKPEHPISAHKKPYDEASEYADIHVEGSFDEFDYESLDHDGEETNSAMAFASKAITKFSLMLLSKSKNPERIWTTVNAICYAAQIHPNQDQSMEGFGKRLGMTKANFSLEVNYWRDLFKLPPTGGSRARTLSVRESFSNAAIESHKKHGDNIRGITMSDSLVYAINGAVRQCNKLRERIETMTPQRKEELACRLKPLADLHLHLTVENAENKCCPGTPNKA